MRIAIIGGGFTGLTAAYTLLKLGHSVTIFERDDHLGGLAWGFRQKNWDWYLEAAYHHAFTSDDTIIALCHELNVPLIIKRPVTANLYHGNPYQFDSPKHLLQFPYLSLPDKLRTGALAAFCKIYPFWQTLEGITAKDFALTIGGQAGWKTIWEPLMIGKFGNLADTVAASWLWARIHKRTSSLIYIEGGFQTLVNALAKTIQKQGGNIVTSAQVTSIQNESGNSHIVYWEKKKLTFDCVLLTTPTPIAYKFIPEIRNTTTNDPLSIPHLWAQTLILETTKPILNNVYWLSITDRSFPFLAVVAHTNFMDTKHYGGNHITYIGNYLPEGHPYLKLSKEQLLKMFIPFIRRLSPNTKYDIRNTYLFTAPNAQPVHQLHYSRVAPKFETDIPHMYLANMDSVYPWDRGTNYAVELGQRAAKRIHEKK